MNIPVKPLSPLPWSTAIYGADDDIVDADSLSVAISAGEQDAEYIVQACNAFPALYAALEGLLSLRCVQAVETIAKASVHSEKETAKRNRSMEIVQQARAALALARGEKGGE